MRTMLATLGVLFALTGARLGQTEAAEPSLDEIRASVDAYARSIQTLTGRQRIKFVTGKPHRQPGAGLTMEDLTLETEFKVDLSHSRMYLSSDRSWFYREISQEPFRVQHQVSSDGERGYSLTWTLSNTATQISMPRNVPHRFGIADTNQINHYVVAPRFAGLQVPGPRVSLTAILSSSEARMTGASRHQGQTCVDVSAPAGGYRIDASLDATKNFLPRRLLILRQRSGPEWRPIYELVASEFRQFPLSENADAAWFPVKGRQVFTETDTQDFELLDLTVNPPLSRADFQIDEATLPPGVLVHAPEGSRYTGNRKDL